MSVPVEVYTWPEVALGGGEEVTLVHWVVDASGASLIEPGVWYGMSGVPEYHGARPDRPLAAAALEVVVQGPVRARVDHPGLANTQWQVTWRNPGPDAVWFRPTMLRAPGR